MTNAVDQMSQNGSLRSRLQQAGPDVALGLVSLTGVSTAAWRLFGLTVGYFAQVTATYLVLACLLVWYLPKNQPHPGLGAANRVTLFRATLILPLSALTAQPILLTNPMAWFIITVATVALILDGVDGWLARRSQIASAFGARFDMELDSFLMLVLSLLVWHSGKVGAWSILIGLPRYLYIAAGWMWPMLRAELPPSLRRKAVCVAQGVLLLVCLGPIVPPPLATGSAAAAVVVLTYSFAVDIIWLARRHPDSRNA